MYIRIINQHCYHQSASSTSRINQHHQPAASTNIINQLHQSASSTSRVDQHHQPAASTSTIKHHHGQSLSIINPHHRPASSTSIIDQHHRPASSTSIINQTKAGVYRYQTRQAEKSYAPSTYCQSTPSRPSITIVIIVKCVNSLELGLQMWPRLPRPRHLARLAP